MLTDFCGDDSLAVCKSVKLLDNVLRKYLVLALDRHHSQCILLFPIHNSIHPSLVLHIRKQLAKLCKDILNVSSNMAVNVDILAYLGRVYINMYDLLILCKCLSVAKNSVGKSRTKNYHKVTFAERHSGCLCAVHTKHTDIAVLSIVKCALTHK